MKTHSKIDKNIRGIINQLKKKGISTRYSCAGHKDNPRLHTGYILFKEKLNPSQSKEAKQVLHSRGIKRVHSKIKRTSKGNKTSFYFKAREA